MNPQLKLLIDKYKAKAVKLEEIVGKDNQTEDEIKSITDLTGELDKEWKAIEALSKRESSEDERKKLFDSIEHPAVEETPKTEAKVLGYTKAGDTYIDYDEQKIISEGAGLFSQKKYEAISSHEYKMAWCKMICKGVKNLTSAELRALQEGIDDQGGFLSPPEFLDRLVDRKATPARVAPLCERWDTGREAVNFPKVDYTGASDDANANIYTTGIRVIYTGETPSSSTIHRVTEPKFGYKRVSVFTAMMSLPVTRDLIEDSPIGVMNFIEEKFRETIGLDWDHKILNGTGAGQARGVLKNPVSSATAEDPQFVVTQDANNITWEGLQDIAWGLPEQYVNENTSWIFNKTSTGLAIAKLKDGQGRPFWSMGLQDSGLENSIVKRSLLGYNVAYSQFMPNVAANAFPYILGDMKGYLHVVRLGFSIDALYEILAEVNQVLLIARLRFGGDIIEPWRLRVGKVSA